tara:strand:+ start:13970 stop:14212 length:243 start_codon:yes stop_codon:yes gene_type:complete
MALPLTAAFHFDHALENQIAGQLPVLSGYPPLDGGKKRKSRSKTKKSRKGRGKKKTVRRKKTKARRKSRTKSRTKSRKKR